MENNLQFSIVNIIKPDFLDGILKYDDVNRHCVVVFPDGKIKTTTRILIFNYLFWKPYRDFNITPQYSDYVELKKLTTDTGSDIFSVMYAKLLILRNDVYHMDIIQSMFKTITIVDNYISMNCRPYASTLDLVGLCKMRQEPEIKALLNEKLDIGQGTAVAEARFNHISKQFIDLISTKGRVKNNVLYNFAVTNHLNKNQLPQWFKAYGPRSDIDDSMNSNIIEESSISGLKTADDFATEGLSVKKSSHSSKKVIKTTQYFNRKLKLACLPMTKIHPGSCGNKNTIKIFLKDAHKKHFLNKVIIVKNKSLILTKGVIDKYVDNHIEMMSPIMCRHLDGVCETCCGMGNNNYASWLPPEIHIGIYTASMMASAVSQMILSAKHLIRTSSMIFSLPYNAKSLLRTHGDFIYLKFTPHELKNMILRVPLSDLSPLSDLKHDDIIASRFSKIKEFSFIKNGHEVDTINLVEDEHYILHLHQEFLEYMKKNLNNIVIDHDYIDIPLDSINIKSKFITHVTHNNDMRRFTKRVFTFFGTHIGNYTSVSECLEDFLDILYSKSGIDVVFVEIVLRCFLMNKNGVVEIPLVEDPNDVLFGRMSSILSNGPISTKLSYQGLSKYFKTVDTYIRPKPVGVLDPIFDYLKV